jgi:hypothetical protein
MRGICEGYRELMLDRTNYVVQPSTTLRDLDSRLDPSTLVEFCNGREGERFRFLPATRIRLPVHAIEISRGVLLSVRRNRALLESESAASLW